MTSAPGPAAEGILLVDKPAGWTSHDVVARIRKVAGTRRVGHAGTLDPLATGLLVLGLGRATRLLGHLTLHDKAYDAVMRLGEETSTDDREGEVLRRADVSQLTEDDVRRAAADLTGRLSQVPPRVSAIKVDGQRAYKRVRAGEDVEMAPREVTVQSFDVGAVRRASEGGLEFEATVTCSSGTYIRSLARDLGVALGSAGHLQELRRTRVGGYDVASAIALPEVGERLNIVPLAEAAEAAFPSVCIDAEQARLLGHGIGLRLDRLDGFAVPASQAVIAALGPDDTLVALVRQDADQLTPLAVFAPS